MSGRTLREGMRNFQPVERLPVGGYLHRMWRDKPHPPFVDPAVADELRATWCTDPDDVFISTHQKVGTHLTKKFVVELLRAGHDYPAGSGMAAGDIGHDTVPWPEVLASQHGRQAMDAFRAEGAGWPRVWYLHTAIEDLTMREVHPQSKFIYIIRDPRSALVSQYFFYQRHPNLGATPDFPLEQFAELFLDGGLFFGDYHDHALGWMNPAPHGIAPEQVLYLRYEDLVERKLAAVKRLAAFLMPDRPLPEERLIAIAAGTDFEAMKQEMKVNPRSFHFNPDVFFRQGRTDGWSDQLTADLARRVVEKSEAKWGPDQISSPNFTGLPTLDP